MTSQRRPLILLPASKGKVDGGEGPGYRATLAPPQDRGPLADARGDLLDALTHAADDLDVAALARLTGVPRDRAEAQRSHLVGLADAPTLPAHRRYTGVVHGNAGLATFDPAAAGVEVAVISPLLGVAAMHDPTPAYRLEFAGNVPDLGRIVTYWRHRAADHLAGLIAERTVWDLLPGEHARLLPTPADHGAPIGVRFVKPDGRAANTARTKVAKGRLTAALIEDPSLTPAGLAGSGVLGGGWTLTAHAAGVVVTWQGG